jgi:hypothetical protein
MSADWTIPFDDVLTLRFRTCMLCAQAADRLELWTAASDEAMALALCWQCLARDARGTRRSALVEAQVRQRTGAET